MEFSCPVAVDDVFVAHERLQRILPPTPVVYSESREALLKLDSLQVTGAFKVRGALNALAAQVERGDHRPVVAASAGNHAQGVACAGRYFGLGICVVLPAGAPRTKIDGCRRLGAEVVLQGSCFEEALQYAGSLAASKGWRFLHAFDDPEVIAGQGTLAVELLPLRPDVVLVPIGGGGLAAGTALVLKAFGIRVIGVQVEGADAMARMLRGKALDSSSRSTIADGLLVHQPVSMALDVCHDLVDDIVVLSEGEVRRAVVDLFANDGIIAEGAGAATVAVLPRIAGGRKVAVISGGNIDGALLDDLLCQRHPART
jgi:threonine dehydratase